MGNGACVQYDRHFVESSTPGSSSAPVGQASMQRVHVPHPASSRGVASTMEVEATPRLDAGCGTCTLCIDACPTGALDEPGVLDSTKCLSYWTQAPLPIPEDYRAELGAQVYGCDICQDVCPWNRGIEKRRADTPLPEEAQPHVRLADWLREDGDARERYDRLYVPRNDPRYLRRNALVALGNTGAPED